MSASGSSVTFRNPYTPTPGGSGPPSTTTPEEGKGELWTFFWLSIVNTTVIGVSGFIVWLFVH
ncbi:MAG: hypothetical protein WA761_05945 [Thermoplasmata archaeon]